MDEMNYKQKIAAASEKFAVVVFAIYCIGTVLVYADVRWAGYINAYLASATTFSLIFVFSKFKTREFRAMFFSITINIAVFMYWVSSEKYGDCMVAFLSLVVVLMLFAIPKIYIACAVNCTLSLIIHLFFIKSFKGESIPQFIHSITQIAALYLSITVAAYVIQRHIEIRKNLERTLELLKDAEEPRKQFFTNVSHEIRTPINTINGVSGLLLQKNQDAEVRDALMDIQTAGRNLLGILSNTLDYMDVENGSLACEDEIYNITSTINDVIEVVNHGIDNKPIQFFVNIDANIPNQLFGDEQKIRRIILCLVDNAMKYTDEGFIYIKVGFRYEKYGINLQISVEDSGCGMPEETREIALLGKSSASTLSNIQNKDGIGLGLRISRAMVDVMGGFIHIDSTEGKGTKVSFVIPQKVVSDDPIVTVDYSGRTKITGYMNLEKYHNAELRAALNENIGHISKQLSLPYHICRSLVELKRWVSRDKYTHMIISIDEYQEDVMYFDILSQSMTIIVICDRKEVNKISNAKIKKMTRPYTLLTIASILNGETNERKSGESANYGRFIAPNVHVLAVDDNLMNLKVVESLLKPYEIKVDKATSGMQALEKIQSQQYDFVFMDHMMPEMDGVECTHRIRDLSGDYFKNVPIIALTANAIAGTREMFLSEGFNDFMAKPIDMSVLERVLNRNIPDIKKRKADDNSNMLEVNSNRKSMEERLKTPEIEIVQLSRMDDFEDVERRKEEIETDELSNTLGCNAKVALGYCGNDVSMYAEMLQSYVDTYPELADKIEMAFDKHMLGDYAINLHSLRAASKTIGYMELSNQAKSLEMAAKLDDGGFVDKHHPDMMEEYKRVVQKILASGLVVQR